MQCVSVEDNGPVSCS